MSVVVQQIFLIVLISVGLARAHPYEPQSTKAVPIIDKVYNNSIHGNSNFGVVIYLTMLALKWQYLHSLIHSLSLSLSLSLSPIPSL